MPLSHRVRAGQCMVSAAVSFGCSIAATRDFTAFCTFSKARTSIWRTRSRETPNSLAKSSSVIGSSASRRASKMRRSRSVEYVERAGISLPTR